MTPQSQSSRFVRAANLGKSLYTWILEQAGIGEDTGEPTGYLNQTSQTTSFVNGTRTFTISPTGDDFSYYIKGIKYTKTEAVSIVIPDTEGFYYFRFDGETLGYTTTWNDNLLYTYALSGIILWDATNNIQIYNAYEAHMTMPWQTHANLHHTVGARISSGGALGNIIADGDGSSASHAQFSNETTTLWDEDLRFSLTARTSTSNIALYYRTGLDASNLWRVNESSSYGVITAGTGRAAYNLLSGGTWSQEEVVNGDFVLAHVFSYNDLTRKFGIIQGQDTYANRGAARDGVLTEINTLILEGLPTAEWKFLGSIIFQTRNTYSNAVKSRIISTEDGDDYIDLRETTITRGGASTSLENVTINNPVYYTDNTLDFDTLKTNENLTCSNTQTNFPTAFPAGCDRARVNIQRQSNSTGDVIQFVYPLEPDSSTTYGIFFLRTWDSVADDWGDWKSWSDDSVMEKRSTTVITIDTDGTQDYTTIQAALDANTSGNELFVVNPGLYTDDTISFTASNQVICGASPKPYSQRVTSTTSNIIDCGAHTGCVVANIQCEVTGATSAINLMQGSGSISALDCTLIMTTAYSTAGAQPALVGGTGDFTYEGGRYQYNHTGNIGSTGNIKSMLHLASGCSHTMTGVIIDINGSGTSGAITMGVDALGSTTALNFHNNVITIDDLGSDIVAALAPQAAGSFEYSGNQIRCTSGAGKTSCGVWILAATQVKARSNYLSIHTGVAGAAYSYTIPVGVEVISNGEVITAANGKNGLGTLTLVGTDENGDMTVTGKASIGNAIIESNSADALVINPFGTGAGETGENRYKELAANGTNYAGWKAPDALAANLMMTLPSADGGNGDVLQTNGSGILSFISPLSSAVSRTVKVIPGATTVVGKVYSAIDTAITYVASQSPGASTPWLVEAYGDITDNFSIIDHTTIIGIEGRTTITGTISSSVANPANLKPILNCSVTDLELDSGDFLRFENCVLMVSAPTISGGVMYALNNCEFLLGDYTGLDILAVFESLFTGGSFDSSLYAFSCNSNASAHTFAGGTFYDTTFTTDVTFTQGALTYYFNRCGFGGTTWTLNNDAADTTLIDCTIGGSGSTITLTACDAFKTVGCSTGASWTVTGAQASKWENMGDIFDNTGTSYTSDDFEGVIKEISQASLSETEMTRIAEWVTDGRITLKETTTPTALANYGKIYTKNDNNFYFQDGAGVEHNVSGDVVQSASPASSTVALWSGGKALAGNTNFVFDGTYVGIGTGVGNATTPLEIIGHNGYVNLKMTHSATDEATKYQRVAMMQWDSDALGLSVWGGWCNETENTVQIGGGTSYLNTATKIILYTATNTTTTAGTDAITIDSSQAIQFNQYGAGTLTTDSSGNITAASDEKLKDILGKFKTGLKELNKLIPIIFKWNEKSGNETENIYAGFSAQNVQKNIPEAVKKDKKGFLTLDDRPIIAAVVNSVQEIFKRIVNIEKKNDQQDKKIKALETKVKDMKKTHKSDIENLIKRIEALEKTGKKK